MAKFYLIQSNRIYLFHDFQNFFSRESTNCSLAERPLCSFILNLSVFATPSFGSERAQSIRRDTKLGVVYYSPETMKTTPATKTQSLCLG